MSNNFLQKGGGGAVPPDLSSLGFKRRRSSAVGVETDVQHVVAPVADLGYRSRVGRMSLERVPDAKGLYELMGMCRRSAVTGEVTLGREASWPDFDLADMWRRRVIHGNMLQFEKDEHLLIPVPLAYRTWLYNDMFFKEKAIAGATNAEFGMLQSALATPCIDAPLPAGRWSPVMCYGPMALILALTGDVLVTLFSIVAFFLLFTIQQYMNKPALYRLHRPVTLPLRMLYVVLVSLRASGFTDIGLFAYVVSIMLAALDLYRGDLQAIMSFRYHCSYEVVKILPNRVFLCRRTGAILQEDENKGLRIAESITGIGAWHTDLHLIADFSGVLAELRPMHQSDWQEIYEEQCSTFRQLTFAGLDVFDDKFPCLQAFAADREELADLARQHKRHLAPDSLLRAEAADPTLSYHDPSQLRMAAHFSPKGAAVPGTVMDEGPPRRGMR